MYIQILPSLFDISQFKISSLILGKYWGGGGVGNNHVHSVKTKRWKKPSYSYI